MIKRIIEDKILADFRRKKVIVLLGARQAKARKEAKVVKQLVVLHTNDTHSCVMPINPNLADTATANRGGFLRRVAMISQERKANPDLLLFDSGDFSQGSPYYSLFKGDVEVGLMNEMKYDAATIGNHEFDFGIDNMVRIFKMAKFPIVCSNYDFTGTELANVVKPYQAQGTEDWRFRLVSGTCRLGNRSQLWLHQISRSYRQGKGNDRDIEEEREV